MTTQTQGSYDSAAHSDLERELARLRNQVLIGWNNESRNLSWFGLRDGMSILEVGSGPGFVTEQLLSLVPKGSVTSVELDPVFIQKAEQYLVGRGGERWRAVNASVVDTRLPDNSFDFAVARFVFQHLPDPLAAAREIRRVLKPGGKLVITDSDDAVWGLFAPAIPEVTTLLERRARLQGARGGNRYVGRDLWRILQDAGFNDIKLEMGCVHSDEVGVETLAPQIDPARLVPLLEAKVITQEEFEAVKVGTQRFLNEPRPIIMMLMLMSCGSK